MKNRQTKRFVLLLYCCSLSLISLPQSAGYIALQEKLCRGWNTWSYGSMLTHVLLPEGLSLNINLRQSFIGTPGDPLYFLNEFTIDTSGLVKPVAHSFDGSYTELILNNWKGNTLRVQSAANGSDLVILFTPVIKSKNLRFNIELESGIMWNREGNIHRNGKTITATFNNSRYEIHSTSTNIETFHPYISPYLVFKGDTTIAFYTGTEKSLADVTAIIEKAKHEYHSYAKKYGDLAGGFEAIQAVLGWNTIYDAEKNRVITPVTRSWNEAWHGYVLFEWDTYLASFLFAIDNKDLAYSNAIAITKGLNQHGYVGQWQMPGMVAQGISQPPVGSMISWMIYEKYREKWFLEEIYTELLSWNRWWENNRIYKNYLTWGCEKGYGHQMAAWESGLDNSPMYDDAKMVDVGKNSLFDLADVGLNSMYVSDCQYLAKIATVLGKSKDANELAKRAEKFKAVTQNLWDKNSGLFLNRFTDQQKFSSCLSPTLFYPMLAGIASSEQGKRMVSEHFYNTEEFYSEYLLPSCAFNDKSYDNQYWRGAIWGPMNFLVYLGLRDYDKKAASDLAEKSYKMFIQAWEKNGAVYENINSLKGVKNPKDQLMSAPFYHWGALMGIMMFMEESKY